MSAPQPDAGELARRFRLFAERECRGVSPLYEALAKAVAEDSALLALAGKARAGQPPPNLLFAAVQALLLADGQDEPLARFYASVTASPAPAREAFPAFRTFCLRRRRAIEATLSRRVVSTNEPARAACLLPAFARAAERLGEPLALLEIGASAGLLLLCDRYAYDYGAAGRVGPAEAALTLACGLRGPAPPSFPPKALPRIGQRLGLDLAPLDPRDADDRAWLSALIWPEERDRRFRLDKALALAAEIGPAVIAGDGIAALATQAARLPGDGPFCLLHAFTLNQVPEAARRQLDGTLRDLGGRRPLARIGFEWQDDRPAPVVSLTLYRGAAGEREDLALADAHGAWIRFL